MNSACRQTSDPAWLDPKGPAVNKPDEVYLAPVIYKKRKPEITYSNVISIVNNKQNTG